MPKRNRIAIVSDGDAWFVRRVRTSVHDGEKDEMVYHCDAPIGVSYSNLDAAVEEAKRHLET